MPRRFYTAVAAVVAARGPLNRRLAARCENLAQCAAAEARCRRRRRYADNGMPTTTARRTNKSIAKQITAHLLNREA
jgi:hypothetical protein